MKVERPIPGPGILHKRRVFRGRTLTGADFLDAYADAYHDRPLFFVDTELTLPGATPGRLTYREVRDHAARIAAVYGALGLKRGDAVATITLNRLELGIGVFAALRAGLVAVPLNFMLTAAEIASAVRRSGARVLLIDRITLRHNLGGSPVAAGGARLVLLDTDDPPHGCLSLPRLLRENAGESPPSRVREDDPALIFFTSGTTGEPKGATISHGALASVIRRSARTAAYMPTPRNQLALMVMPLAHNGGFIGLLMQLCLGIPSLVISRFSAQHVLELIEEVRPTMFTGTPAMYRLLLDAGAEGYDLSSIRVWGGGADLFPRDLLDRLRALGGWRRLGMRFKPFTMIGYGSAETAGQVTISPPIPVGDSCIGWVLPGFEYRIVDEDDNDVRPGTAGELCVRGGSVMSGYWDDAEATDASMRRGWFHTGDIVRRGPMGLLYYEARRKDVIKSGGYSIPAREIEHVLEQHPAVQQAAAVGLPDRIKGERPVAAVVLREVATPEELEAFAAERLAGYKRPRRVYVVDDIPLTATLKPRKNEVRERLIRFDG
jgi:acyl-CoA synthetase (AMP-forming)/AMP-acid ligase II